MARLTWGDISDRRYQAGLDRGVFYDKNGNGQAWNGLVSAYISDEASEGIDFYQDGVKFHTQQRLPHHAVAVEVFSYPEVIHDRSYIFGLSYRVTHSHGYQIHIYYNVLAQSTEHVYSATDQPAVPFKINLSTVKALLRSDIRTAHIVIDSEVVSEEVLSAIEDALYGSATSTSQLPSLDEVLDIFQANAELVVVDNLDGSFTITGPETAVVDNLDDTFTIAWPSVTQVDANTYRIQSL